MDELPLHQVLDNLKQRIADLPLGNPQFKDRRYHPQPLNPRYVYPIKMLDAPQTICYLDGGNTAIARAPNFIVELTRLYYCIFRGKKKLLGTLPHRIEFYTVCCAASEQGEIVYQTEFIPVQPEWASFLPDPSDLRFHSFDNTLMTGRLRAIIDRVADSARLFSEWSYARHLITEELEANDVFVKDGTLQTSVTNEAKYAESAYDAAQHREVIFTGLAKTSRLFTTTGQPLFSAIKRVADTTEHTAKAWFYHPIADITHPDHRAEMFAVRLQRNSEYVFRFEILRDQFRQMSENEVASVINALAQNAVDMCFPGYPYGLIEADKLARVTGRERDALGVQFRSVAASTGLWTSLNNHLKCINAHSLLDNLARG
jgi:hypothetical protein